MPLCDGGDGDEPDTWSFGALAYIADELRVGIAGRNSSWGRQPASVMPEPEFIEIGSMCKAVYRQAHE